MVSLLLTIYMSVCVFVTCSARPLIVTLHRRETGIICDGNQNYESFDDSSNLIAGLSVTDGKVENGYAQPVDYTSDDQVILTLDNPTSAEVNVVLSIGLYSNQLMGTESTAMSIYAVHCDGSETQQPLSSTEITAGGYIVLDYTLQQSDLCGIRIREDGLYVTFGIDSFVYSCEEAEEAATQDDYDESSSGISCPEGGIEDFADTNFDAGISVTDGNVADGYLTPVDDAESDSIAVLLNTEEDDSLSSITLSLLLSSYSTSTETPQLSVNVGLCDGTERSVHQQSYSMPAGSSMTLDLTFEINGSVCTMRVSEDGTHTTFAVDSIGYSCQ